MTNDDKIDWNDMPQISMEIEGKWQPVIRINPDMINIVPLLNFLNEYQKYHLDNYREIKKINKKAK